MENNSEDINETEDLCDQLSRYHKIGTILCSKRKLSNNIEPNLWYLENLSRQNEALDQVKQEIKECKKAKNEYQEILIQMQKRGIFLGESEISKC